MRYVVLSFDDGRKDFYTNAFPVLRKYGLPATLNVITDTLGREDPAHMTEAEVLECAAAGVEIACHSADHTNGAEQILRGAERLEAMLKAPRGGVGFASPESEICWRNFGSYAPLLREGRLLYIRSGNQVRRDGYLYAALYVLYRATKSKALFRWYNRRNLIRVEKKPREYFYPSVTCNAENSMGQVLSLLRKMPDNTAAVVMLHSVLPPEDPGREAGKWRSGTEEFEELCRYLAGEPGLRTVTNARLHGLLGGE